MKILHVHVALYQPWLMTRALRRLGHEADCLIFGVHGNDWLIHGTDYDLEYKTVPRVVISAYRALKIAKNYDVIHFHSLMSLLPMCVFRLPFLDRMHLKWLKKTGKKIVVSHWGCHDGIRPSVYSKFGNNPCSECNAYGGMCTDKHVTKKCSPQVEFADVIINHEPSFEDFNAKAVYVPAAIDTEFWSPDEEVPERYRIPKSDGTVYLLHAFANSERRGGVERNIKGTPYIVAAVKRLKSEGHKVELLHYDKVPNEEFKYLQLQADVVVDQLFLGWYGSFARECMALGKPVIGYIRGAWRRNQLHDIPVMQAEPETIYDVLKKVVTDKELREELGSKSRRYAEEVLSMNRVAEQLTGLYKGRR